MVNTNKKGWFWCITWKDAQGEGHSELYFKGICFLQFSPQWITVMSGRLGLCKIKTTSRQKRLLSCAQACEGHRKDICNYCQETSIWKGKTWSGSRAKTRRKVMGWGHCWGAVPPQLCIPTARRQRCGVVLGLTWSPGEPSKPGATLVLS